MSVPEIIYGSADPKALAWSNINVNSLRINGSGIVPYPPGQTPWFRGGNGTVVGPPNLAYLGTLDATGVMIVTNDTPAIAIGASQAISVLSAPTIVTNRSLMYADQYPTVQGLPGQILTTNGATPVATLSWQNAGSADSPLSIVADGTTTEPQIVYNTVYSGYSANNNFVIGPQTTEGAGTRAMMILAAADPGFGSFRSGTVTGTQWNQANRGLASVAMGGNCSALGNYSVALGQAATADTNNCFVWSDGTATGGGGASSATFNAFGGFFAKTGAGLKTSIPSGAVGLLTTGATATIGTSDGNALQLVTAGAQAATLSAVSAGAVTLTVGQAGSTTGTIELAGSGGGFSTIGVSNDGGTVTVGGTETTLAAFAITAPMLTTTGSMLVETTGASRLRLGTNSTPALTIDGSTQAITVNSTLAVQGASATIGVDGSTTGELVLASAGGGTATVTAPAGGVTPYSVTWPAAQGTGALTNNGSGVLSWSVDPSNAFIQNGNAFGAGGVLGTTDNQSLTIITNNTQALLFSASQAATFSSTLAVNGSSLTVGVSGLTGGSLVLSGSSSGTAMFTPSANATIMAVGGSDILSATGFAPGLITSEPTNQTITMTVASKQLQNVTGTGGASITFVLPDARTLVIGAGFSWNNNSDGSVFIQDAGLTPLYTVPPGGYASLYLFTNVAIQGAWNIVVDAPATVTWGTNTLTNSAALTFGTSANAALTIETNNTAALTILGTQAATFSSTLVARGASVTVGVGGTTTGSLILESAGSANAVTIAAPASGLSAYSWTLPTAQGGTGTFLQNNGSGVLSWLSPNSSSGFFLQDGNSFGTGALLGTNDANSLTLYTNNVGATNPAIVIDTSQGVTFGANTNVQAKKGFVLSGNASGPVVGNFIMYSAAGTQLTLAPGSAAGYTFSFPAAVPAALGYQLTSTTGGVTSWIAPQTGRVTTTTSTNTTSTTYVASALAVTITPQAATSHVFIAASFTLGTSAGANVAVYCTLTRQVAAGTIVDLATGSAVGAVTNAMQALYVGGPTAATVPASLSWTDAPATTSTVTYTVYVASGSASDTGTVNTGTASITAMELMGGNVVTSHGPVGASPLRASESDDEADFLDSVLI